MSNVKELGQIALGTAAGELQRFVSQFRALTAVSAALQEAGGLERRLVSLRQELEGFPAKRQAIEDGIVKAAEGKLAELRAQAETQTAKRDALRAETEAARKELAIVKDELESKQEALKEIEGHVADLKAKLS